MKDDPGVETTERLLCRIRGEYMEMPGLRLTAAQAQRLLGLAEQSCANLLGFLVEVKFLYQTGDGRFARLTEGGTALPPIRMAKAQLDSKPATPATVDKPSAA
jgi:hypothetical protein